MSAALQAGAQAFLSRYEGLKQRLPGDPLIREDAARAFAASGLPGPRNEAWKYTSLRPLTEAQFHEPLIALADCSTLLERLPPIDAPRLVFVDGHRRGDLSSDIAALKVYGFAQTPDFGRLPKPEREPLTALNTMLAEDGAVIRVPDGVDGGVLMLANLGVAPPGRPVAFHPRHVIRLGRGARLTVVEVAIGRDVYLHNAVGEIVVGTDARLTHIRLQEEADRALHFSTVYVDVADRGTYDSFVLNLGARLARTEIHARLGGPGGTAHLNGAQLLRGVQHADFTTVVAHDAPNCTSRQTVKNVLTGRSRGVFQARIEVARGAQKTDGYQMNQALLLSPEAEIDSKPELEIFADDVKCSHGATVGELDADQLFYLRSRGIPDQEARAMLVRAFLAEALDPIAHDAVRAALEAAVERWWERQAA
jgi:Fe-S cluster assembly protein SufD